MPEQALHSATARTFSSCACKSHLRSCVKVPPHIATGLSRWKYRTKNQNTLLYCAKPQSERLTWSLTPHSPAGAFAHKDSASPLLTLSEKFWPAGLTSKARHARRTFAGLRGSLCPRLASTCNHRRARTACFHYRKSGAPRQAFSANEIAPVWSFSRFSIRAFSHFACSSRKSIVTLL